MRFLNIISELINVTPKDDCKYMDKAILCGLFQSPPPIARHILFTPLSGDKKQQLVDAYALHFPDELLKLYSRTNGANLFWGTVFHDRLKRSFPVCHFSIYGYPEATRQHIEPYNIKIEDLAHPVGTPNYWLKFGSYIPPIMPLSEQYLYIDTQSLEIHALTGGEQLCEVQSWKNLDSCLCDLFYKLESSF